jgi:stage II sporulation protein E
VLLCDGMGTGEAAARESLAASELLKTMHTAGLAPEQALRSLNSLAILRDLGGCVTVDLLEVELDTGRGRLCKWGAAQSWLLQGEQAKKIGTAGPPPGLSQSCRETVDRLSLGRGETLILVSDGVSEEWLVNSARTTSTLPPGELAAAILDWEISGGDDATAAVIRLSPASAS